MSNERQLFDRLDQTMVGNYETWSARGDAMWHIISSAPHQTQRVQLMAHLLVNFDAKNERSGSVKRVPGTGLSNAEYAPICEQLVPLIDKLSAVLLTENRTATTTARHVLRFLETLKSDSERMVAIALLLRRNLVPYLQIPKDLFRGEPADYAPLHARPHVRRSIALIMRVLRQPQLTVAMLGTALQKILAGHRDPDEHNALLCELAKAMAMKLQPAQGATVHLPSIIIANIEGGTMGQAVLELLHHLLGNMPDGLRTQIVDTHHCGDPNCPLRKAKSEDSAAKPN